VQRRRSESLEQEYRFVEDPSSQHFIALTSNTGSLWHQVFFSRAA